MTTAPSFIINGQYVKDLSFENPLAPKSLFGAQEKPAIELAVDVKAQRLKDDTFEVAITLNANAKAGEEPMFLAELVYAGVFTLTNTPAEQIEYMLLAECPQTLFPFARRVIADVTRDGGFPPLMLEPMDFRALYAQRTAATKETGGKGKKKTEAA